MSDFYSSEQLSFCAKGFFVIKIFFFQSAEKFLNIFKRKISEIEICKSLSFCFSRIFCSCFKSERILKYVYKPISTLDRSKAYDEEVGGEGIMSRKSKPKDVELSSLGKKKNSFTSGFFNIMKIATRQNENSSKEKTSALKVFTEKKGVNLVIQNEGIFIGKGLVLSNFPIEQDKLFFQIEVMEIGMIFVGVSRDLNKNQIDSFEGCYFNNLFGIIFGHIDAPIVEVSDIIICTVDQSDIPPRLDYYINGIFLSNYSITNPKMKGQLWITLGISDGASIKACFDEKDCKRYSDIIEQKGFSCLSWSRRII